MSAETKAALDAALEAHVTDEADVSGAICTGYVLQAQFTSHALVGEGLTGYMRFVQEGQNFTTSLGLSLYMNRQLEHATTEE